jgi:multidrug efflux pump subunit AcrB
MSEEEVYDYRLYVLRTQLSTVQGLTMPTPYGGRERQVMVDIDPNLLQAKGVSPKEVADAVNAYNLASPTGVADRHTKYPVTLNNTPLTPDSFQRDSAQSGRRCDDLHARRRPSATAARRNDRSPP